jgi:hypothetical protein
VKVATNSGSKQIKIEKKTKEHMLGLGCGERF